VIVVEDTLELTKAFIRARTDNEEGVINAIGLAESWLRAKGVRVYRETNCGLPMLVGFAGNQGSSKEPVVMLNGHLDVVPAKPEQFEPLEKDGRLFARGSYDMLGAAATMMRCLADWAGSGRGRGVGLMLVPSEETAGEIGTQYLLDKGYGAEFAICGEPTDLGIAVEAKGVLQVEIVLRGKSAHGSKPWEGENAIEAAFETYERIRQSPFMKERTQSYQGPSLNLARIEGGDAINRVPDRCMLTVDIRYLPCQSCDEIVRQINSAAQGAVVRVINVGIPVSVSKDNPHVTTLAQCVYDICGSNPTFVSQHGSADTRFFTARGIPAVEFGPVGANHHGDDEYVQLDSLAIYRRILDQFIWKEVSHRDDYR
jgi:succinyl-diaminopimelate desuccinylase